MPLLRLANLLFASALVASVKDECVFSAKGASFDVTALKMGMSASYHVKDIRDTVENNYTYVFNVCGYATPPANECIRTVAGRGAAPAFQVYDNGKSCHRLGGVGEKYRKFSLLDEDDPTYGVSLTYTGGDKCSEGKIDRSMTVKFICAETWGNTPNARVKEDECSYELEFQTVFGCPQECPFVDRALCGGKGFCGMDSDTNKPKCFCNEGHTGPDCMTLLADLDQGGCDGTCVALIFVMLLLVALLLAGGVIFYRVKKLQSLNLKFGLMSDTFNHEEQMGLTSGR